MIAHSTDSGSVVSVVLSGEVVAGLDRAAAEDLVSRSAYVRRLLVEHLRASDHLSRTAPVTPAGSRRAMASAA